jgi:hypothetical protein
MTVHFPKLFSSSPSQTSQNVDAAQPTRRRSTTISMLEEEFGICEPPKTTTRFGLPPKLRILPPKRKKSTTQVPVPRPSLSFLNGPCETLWACDEDGVDLIESVESPLEGSFPDLHWEQDSELDQDLATPTNDNSWSSDGELTPQFFSNFPSTLEPDPLRHEGHPDGKLLESVLQASSPIEPDTP